MKILLTAVNAKYIHSNPAVYSLRAYAGEALRDSIEIAEYTINNSREEILASIYEKNPDVIAFSCYIWNWNMIQGLLTELPKILPGRDIWLGGPEVSFDAPKLLEQYPQITGIMIGEGEETFKELAECYVNHKITADNNDKDNNAKDNSIKDNSAVDNNAKDSSTKAAEEAWQNVLRNIKGLALRTGITAPRDITDMNTIPFLYESLKPFENRILYYESSRGCPYSCSYCLSSIDKKVRFRDMNVVFKELQFFLDHRVPQVKFVDRTFNCRHDHALAIWKYIHEHDNGVTNFHFEISADILNEEELQLLNSMRPGLVQLEIGVQTANPNTIEAIHRKMDLAKLETIVARIHDGHNIHIHLDLIAGLPYEDYESFRRSFDRVYHMKPHQLQLGFLKVLKGSYMHEHSKDYELAYLDQPPYEVLSTTWLCYKDVVRLKRIEEMVELYYNSNQFTHTLPVLIQRFDGPFRFFEALAEYYKEKNYYTNAPARAYRYQVLLSFALEHDSARADLYRELLTYDLYLRENAKSRPDFAKDLQPYKEQMRKLYKQEEEERQILPDYQSYDSRQLERMTHLERFTYSVWKEDGQREFLEKPQYVLFDYKRRSPLTQEARAIRLEVTAEYRFEQKEKE